MPAKIPAPIDVISEFVLVWMITPVVFANRSLKYLFSVIPPSVANIFNGLEQFTDIASSKSATWCATPSIAARVISFLVVFLFKPGFVL